MIKTFEEYRYFKVKSEKVYGWDSNIKDDDEPFFNINKKEYKRIKKLKSKLPHGWTYEYYLDIKKKLIDGGFKGEIRDNFENCEDHYSWYINENIIIYISGYYKYDRVIYNARGSRKMIGSKKIEVPHINANTVNHQSPVYSDVDGIIKSLLLADNIIRDFKKKASEFKSVKKTNVDIDPYGEDDWGDEESDSEYDEKTLDRKERDFWEDDD